jgi:hypothetical protein
MASQSYQLVMRSGPTPGKIYELNKDEIFIGRDVNNEIIINDAEVSRKHARVILQAGGYVLEDLGSTNGTFVNGHRLMGPHVLRSGELILFGENVTLVFETSLDADATLAAVPADFAPTPAAPPRAPEPYQPPPPASVEVFPPPPAPQREPYYPPEPAYSERQQEPVYPPPAPSYSGQVPSGPAEPYYAEPAPVPPPSNRNRRTIIAGCGCLLLLICLCLAASGYFFDQANLYCAPPFDAFSPLYDILFGAACP